MVKIFPNPFKLQSADINISQIPVLETGESSEAMILLNNENEECPLEKGVLVIECALRVLMDEQEEVFRFKTPCCLSVAMLDNPEIGIEEYK